MDRRTFQLAALVHACGMTAGACAAASPAMINPASHIKALHIDQGPLRGAYRMGPSGQINWYFANLGLSGLIPELAQAELEWRVRPYLELYLDRLEPDASIRDVGLDGSGLQPLRLSRPDSDDSYAATFLSLATQYLRAAPSQRWWRRHRTALLDIAQRNLVSQLKPNGLCRAFQQSRAFDGSDLGYTMNNCEVYRGLRDLADLLEEWGPAAWARGLRQAARRIGQSVASVLWDAEHKGYRVSDLQAHARADHFYPDCCCQVFAQALNVVESRHHDDDAYAFLNFGAPRWPEDLYDPFPWCMLAYVAALRGDTDRAVRQLSSTAALLQREPESVTINEFGFWLRTLRRLQARRD